MKLKLKLNCIGFENGGSFNLKLQRRQQKRFRSKSESFIHSFQTNLMKEEVWSSIESEFFGL